MFMIGLDVKNRWSTDFQTLEYSMEGDNIIKKTTKSKIIYNRNYYVTHKTVR